MKLDAREYSGDVLQPVGFDPTPAGDFLLSISQDRILRFGPRIYDALAASGYRIVRQSDES